jgi:membrane protease YdiL (CAAX protease family)
MLRRLTLLAPPILILTSLAVFQVTEWAAGDKVAQVMGFAFYWIVAGVIFPMVILGRAGYVALFSGPPIEWTITLPMAIAALFLPAVFGFLFAFPYLFPADTGVLLATLALYALFNGTLEEVFWRGLFITQFRTNPWLGVLYPGVMFGIWQLVPWAHFDAWLRPPAIIVLAVAIPIGVLYAWVAGRTGSIRWTVLAHVLTNLSGIGALLIFARPG